LSQRTGYIKQLVLVLSENMAPINFSKYSNLKRVYCKKKWLLQICG
jgi:hypothetical protein